MDARNVTKGVIRVKIEDRPAGVPGGYVQPSEPKAYRYCDFFLEAGGASPLLG